MDNKQLPRQHQAVALSYERGTTTSPQVVAKGRGQLADRIVELAAEHCIPIYKNKTLTGLLMAVELDREIPPELYKAVAEVLAQIYRLDQRLQLQQQARLLSNDD